jgi:transcription antitermination protein NusB
MSGARSRVYDERHQARTLALQILFETDFTTHALKDIVRRYSRDMELPPELRDYVERLVLGVRDGQPGIDEAIAGAATAFPVDQLPAVDRNILRIAIFELREAHDVPVKAVINEAVELAKHFGGDSSSRFVNGVLGTLAKQLPAARTSRRTSDA